MIWPIYTSWDVITRNDLLIFKGFTAHDRVLERTVVTKFIF